MYMIDEHVCIVDKFACEVVVVVEAGVYWRQREQCACVLVEHSAALMLQQ